MNNITNNQPLGHTHETQSTRMGPETRGLVKHKIDRTKDKPCLNKTRPRTNLFFPRSRRERPKNDSWGPELVGNRPYGPEISGKVDIYYNTVEYITIMSNLLQLWLIELSRKRTRLNRTI